MFTKRALVRCIVIGAVALNEGGYAVAQTTQPTEAEKAMAAQIKCEDFKKNPDGTWTSGPNAKIGGMTFSNNRFETRGFNIGGADVAVVLNQKCGEIGRTQ